MLKRLVFLTLTCALASAAGLLVGCGQKGPLYLPTSEPAPVETPVQTTAEKPEKPEQKASTE